jgi:hypothetical protein
MKKCSKCGSPYYGRHHRCAGTAAFAFKTRRQMGLRDGELPYKFRVDIGEKDTETEVSDKRALLHLNSQRVYMQMGCAAQALSSMRQVANWLGRLMENMDEEDRAAMAPTLEAFEISFHSLEDLSRKRADIAVRMEELVERERRKARGARTRLMRESAEKSRRMNEFGILGTALPFRGLEGVPLPRAAGMLRSLGGMPGAQREE